MEDAESLFEITQVEYRQGEIHVPKMAHAPFVFEIARAAFRMLFQAPEPHVNTGFEN